jgi:outer membrane protein assembly factor BamA
MNSIAKQLTPEQKVSIEAIEFDGAIHLPAEVMDQLIAELKQQEFEIGPEWLDVIQEVPIRSAWQDNGYFRVKTRAESQMVHSDLTHLYFSVTVHVDEGLQYRVGDIRFIKPLAPGDPTVYFSGEGSRPREASNIAEPGTAGPIDPAHAADSLSGGRLPKRVPPSGGVVSDLTDPVTTFVFPVEELRKLLSMQEGDILSANRVRSGLEAMKKFYGKNGYPDFTATPFLDIDDEHQLVSLRFELDEGKQFRIGKIEVFGLDANARKILIWNIKPGDVFDNARFEAFFTDNHSVLPAGISFVNPQLYRNGRTGIVDIKIGVSPCPQQ